MKKFGLLAGVVLALSLVFVTAHAFAAPVEPAGHTPPGKPVFMMRVGMVTAYTPGSSITIKASDGNSYTFALVANPRILPPGRTVGLGNVVTIIAPRRPFSTTPGIALAIVVHPSATFTPTATATATDTPTDTPTVAVATDTPTATPTDTATATP